MNTYYNSIILLAAAFAVVMILDRNVADYFLLLIRFSKLRLEKFLWLASNHPWIYFNPITKKILFIKYYFQARELEKELRRNCDDEKIAS